MELSCILFISLYFFHKAADTASKIHDSSNSALEDCSTSLIKNHSQDFAREGYDVASKKQEQQLTKLQLKVANTKDVLPCHSSEVGSDTGTRQSTQLT